MCIFSFLSVLTCQFFNKKKIFGSFFTLKSFVFVTQVVMSTFCYFLQKFHKGRNRVNKSDETESFYIELLGYCVSTEFYGPRLGSPTTNWSHCDFFSTEWLRYCFPPGSLDQIWPKTYQGSMQKSPALCHNFSRVIDFFAILFLFCIFDLRSQIRKHFFGINTHVTK